MSNCKGLSHVGCFTLAHTCQLYVSRPGLVLYYTQRYGNCFVSFENFLWITLIMAKRVFNNIPYLMHSILPQSKLNCVHTWLVPRRMFHKSLVKRDGKFNEPIPSNELPRFAGIASFFRLPIQRLDTKGISFM